MRGKASIYGGSNVTYGITPAYAGKRQKSSIRISAYRDHPRLCGEKLLVLFFLMIQLGSPPPMRGKVFPVRCIVHGHRITPAYAGKSILDYSRLWRSEDHPRLCGEKLCPFSFARLFLGSPPPMRGKVIFFLLFVMGLRITPAYAGKRHSEHCQVHSK